MKHISVVVSLDVEEEGLFRNGYGLTDPQVTNVSAMHRLRPLMRLGIRPTLFCAHPVFADETAWKSVAAIAETGCAEIGSHLHHWNTPPVILPGTTAPSVPSCRVPQSAFREKLETLLAAGERRMGHRPASFRMGRWDLRRQHWKILADAGITADASVRPLHCPDRNGLRPDHFHAPCTPYLAAAGEHAVFELPLTVTPLLPFLPGFACSGPLAPLLAPSFEHWGVLSLLPVYHPLCVMKKVTALAIARGQDAISLTWHSSEMVPGGNPKLRTQADVEALMCRLAAYVSWLRSEYSVRFRTLGELREERAGRLSPLACESGDWTGPSSRP